MKEEKADKEISKYKPCCNSVWYKKGRANFRCKVCDRDVTLEIMLLYQVLIK